MNLDVSSWCSSSEDEISLEDIDGTLGFRRNDNSTLKQVQRQISSSTAPTDGVVDLMSKCIIHLDIDCFYCQCEEILNPKLATKPVAIGQKHIVVTANYIARRLGVKKLMGRREAMQLCPSLIIIEGSDLEKYRKASREVYVEFRQAVKDLGEENIVKKGCMDEMFADVTCAVVQKSQERALKGDKLLLPPKTFIYGEDVNSLSVKISEDQSGAEAMIHQSFSRSTTQVMSNNHHWGSNFEKSECEERLKMGIIIASEIRERIREKTKFSTTVGVSVSPMLSKLSCDFKKPDANNLLYPWRSKSIIDNMPLRRIPDLGSRTLKALNTCLQQYNRCKQNDEFWTCRDLLQVPRHEIITCLSKHDSFQKKCEEHCDLLINRCNGIDTTPVMDDGGGLSKTISVEDSFIRGSVLSFSTVEEKLQSLYRRLLRLLVQRRDLSAKPHLSYPKAIRVAVRIVDRSLENSGRRPFRTVSKQSTFNGKQLMDEIDVSQQESILKSCALPLLTCLLKDGTILDLNVTRLNIAVVAFADIDPSSKAPGETKSSKNGTTNSPKESLLKYFSPNHYQQASKSKEEVKSSVTSKRKQSSSISVAKKDQLKRPKQMQADPNLKVKVPSEIDPLVLASLPADIAEEVLKNPTIQHTSFKKEKTLRKNKGISRFFKKK